MIINITGKNFTASEQLKQRIEKKLGKLDKYFSQETVANVMLSNIKEGQKLEATINADGMIFRAENTNSDIEYALDKVVDRLSSQMSRFKQKLIRKHQGPKGIIAAEIPDAAEEAAEVSVVKTKRFRINPMTTEEAILQMELLGHSFFVFRDAETNRVNIVYKRNDGGYGLLETEN
jgi:putative sigma-54 modulation protein